MLLRLCPAGCLSFEKLNWDSQQGRGLATSGGNKKNQLYQSYSNIMRKVFIIKFEFGVRPNVNATWKGFGLIVMSASNCFDPGPLSNHLIAWAWLTVCTAHCIVSIIKFRGVKIPIRRLDLHTALSDNLIYDVRYSVGILFNDHTYGFLKHSSIIIYLESAWILSYHHLIFS